MSNIAISFKNVTKSYNKDGKYQPSLREWIGAIFSGKHFHRTNFQALDNISFEIKRGQVVGFIGSNGAGKSTILKLMSKITYPTSGEIEVNGSVAGLLELGTGFHPELTGEENVYLYSSILGFSKKKIASLYQEIVDFSELKDFMQTPIKHYSSGMVARLGFAVAINISPDILLIDEVLAVGDLSFQKKCMDFMTNYCKNPNNTVVFITHNIDNVKKICDEVIWIEKGRIIDINKTISVVPKYIKSQSIVKNSD